MILRRGFPNWLVITIAALSGCTQVQANDASNLPAHGETSEARQADAESEVLRGFQYTFGPSKDYHQAFALFRHAADQGSANGEYSVAQSYDAGEGVEKDEIEAVVWYRKAAEHGLPAARARLRTMFVRGQLVPVDDDNGGKWWRELVRKANDESQAFSRAYAAAEQGSADAKVQLGIDYLTGVGVSKDRTQAASLFQQAAEQGQTEAQCLTAAISAADDDWAIPAETKHAADLCLNAANHGYANAQLILGTFYTMGRGVPKDATQAAFWHRKAAEQGRRDAEFSLAYDYERGNGVPKDDTQRLFWLRKAADHSYPWAMTSLAIQSSLAHTTGKDDPLANPEMAKKFLDLGVEYAPEMYREMLPNMWANHLEQERERQTQVQLRRVLAPALKAMGIGDQ